MKTALVTGGAQRLGYEITKILLEEHYQLILHYNQSHEKAKEIAQSYPQTKLIQYDFKQKTLDSFFDQIFQYYEHIDILFLNAAVFYQTPWSSLTPKDWDELMNINAKIPFFIAHGISQRNQSDKPFKIIFISDIYAQKSLENFSIYSLTKSLIHNMVSILAKELKGKASVNAIAPGSILKAHFAKPSPLAKDIQPNPERLIAFQEAIKYFIHSPLYISGQVLYLWDHSI